MIATADDHVVATAAPQLGDRRRRTETLYTNITPRAFVVEAGHTHLRHV